MDLKIQRNEIKMAQSLTNYVANIDLRMAITWKDVDLLSNDIACLLCFFGRVTLLAPSSVQ